jgi:3-oxoadipate enol-lactonase
MSFASVNGQELFFEDTGGDGYPIVMMHGFLMDQSLFDPQVKVLAPTYRCIRFDARAFGQTKWDTKPFNLYDTASDCVGLMDHLGIKHAVIAGMSQGGYAALRMALKNPERIKALVLMSTWAGVDDEPTKAQFRQMRDTWASAGPIEPLMEGLATVLLGPKDAPGMAANWDAWLPKWRNYPANAIVHGMNNLLDRDDISARISEIKHPALSTHGDSDHGMPIALGEQLSKMLPNSQGFVVVAGAAHAANYTHPQVVNTALLNFMKKATS